MKKRTRWYGLATAIALLLLGVWVLSRLGGISGGGNGAFLEVAPEDVPDISFQAFAPGADRSYLGAPAAGDFTLTGIAADVLLLEFMNVQCKACQRQSSGLRKAFEHVQDRDDLRDRIKFMAVAVGNNAEEAERFRKKYRIPFPVHADPFFKSYEKVGTTGGLPFLLVITLRPVGGGSYVATAHEGLVRSADRLVEELTKALGARWEDWKSRASQIHLGDWQNLRLSVSDDYVRRLLKEATSEIGLNLVESTEVAVDNDDVVYRLRVTPGPPLWAKVLGRVKICNLCHDIYFILFFDDRGTVVHFSPIRVTKNNNLNWDEADNAFMRRRLVGRSVLGPVLFDPETDAVSTATMSSALIVDAVRRLGDTYRHLADKGLIPAIPQEATR